MEKGRVAKEYIVMTVDKKPLQLLMTCDTAKEMWDKLLAIYEQKSTTSIHLIQRRFYEYRMDPADDIACHIAKLEGLGQSMDVSLPDSPLGSEHNANPRTVVRDDFFLLQQRS